MPRTRTFPKPREFPRDVMLKLPSDADCCTVEETMFWNQTMLMAQNGSRPREVAEFAASGLDDPMLARAYPFIRDAMRKWAEMGDVWQHYGNQGPDSQEVPAAWYQS